MEDKNRYKDFSIEELQALLLACCRYVGFYKRDILNVLEGELDEELINRGCINEI